MGYKIDCIAIFPVVTLTIKIVVIFDPGYDYDKRKEDQVDNIAAKLSLVPKRSRKGWNYRQDRDCHLLYPNGRERPWDYQQIRDTEAKSHVWYPSGRGRA